MHTFNLHKHGSGRKNKPSAELEKKNSCKIQSIVGGVINFHQQGETLPIIAFSGVLGGFVVIKLIKPYIVFSSIADVVCFSKRP